MRTIEISWPEFKVKAKELNFIILYIETDDTYIIYAKYEYILFETVLIKNTTSIPVENQETEAENVTDFEENYKPSSNIPNLYTDAFKKHLVHNTCRPPHTDTYYTGSGDGNLILGNAQAIDYVHKNTDPLEEVMYLDFLSINNESFLHHGYISFIDGLGDIFDFEVVVKKTDTEAAENTNFKLYTNIFTGKGLILPAAGNGDLNITGNMNFVEAILCQKKMIMMPGFWNADYDEETNTFSNITPAPTGNGKYNLFDEEYVFNHFMNKIPCRGTCQYFKLQSDDTARVGYGFRIKITFKTSEPNHAWSMTSFLAMHRERSC